MPSYEEMTSPVEQNSEKPAPEHATPADNTALAVNVSLAPVSAVLTSPSPEGRSGATAHLQDLTDRARAYVEAAASANTRRAYASDWKHFAAWCRRQNLPLLPADPQVVGLYITACAAGRPMSVSTIERRLSSLCWNYAQRGGEKLDRRDRAIATVLTGIRNRHAAPPRQKEAILPEDLVAMLETLDRASLRGLRDRAMLLIGFAGGLRRSEITGLDLGRDQSEDGRGWVEIFERGLLLTLRGKTGWREVEIGRGSRLPRRRARNLDPLCQDRQGTALPPRDRQRQGRRPRPAQRPGGGPPRQEDGAGRRRARRSSRGRARAEIRRPFAARRPRLLGRSRRTPRPEAARARLRRNDPPLPAPPRQVPRQPHQGCRALSSLPPSSSYLSLIQHWII